ncbi:PLP-dependent transferase [Zoogloea sp. LCSB751]|uniref:PLP-dependent transferase n=1 Tax=Zoogloea sp. LCSB751 TaxID=1965277 RepID=UPI0020B1447B|nr:PLP-dependent transferase [Zoogloea sp. LCSB751]
MSNSRTKTIAGHGEALGGAVTDTGLGDTRTLIIPVAPTIFWEAGQEARAAMGIAEGLIRLSIGLEDEADLIADFDRALA